VTRESSRIRNSDMLVTYLNLGSSACFFAQGTTPDDARNSSLRSSRRRRLIASLSLRLSIKRYRIGAIIIRTTTLNTVQPTSTYKNKISFRRPNKQKENQLTPIKEFHPFLASLCVFEGLLNTVIIYGSPEKRVRNKHEGSGEGLPEHARKLI
jgi:hypothetical protein